VEALEGDYTAAYARYEESLAIGSEVGENLNITFNLEGLADVATVQGEPAWAARLLGSAEALREAIGTPIYRADYERSVAVVRAHLSEKLFAAAWEEGRMMTPEQAPAAEGQPLLPSPSPSSKPAATYPDGLTAREVDVLCLLGQGLTSGQIAEQLMIGVVTVNFHVRAIYSKLGVT
jgi:DNA-binding CsgD family transcriptional regulator